VKGRLITLEGIDGVGKTTHLQTAVDYLNNHSLNVKTYREPGGTELGEQLRRIIKLGTAQSALAELMLFTAARAELVETAIKPALEEGAYIVLDRFTESTLAYQGALGGIDERSLHEVCLAASGGITPDLTFWLDLEPAAALMRRYPMAEVLAEQGQTRVSSQEMDAIERRDPGYFERVRARYRSFMEHEPDRIKRIDVSGTVEQTADLICSELASKLREWNSG
jgi:dTMP kinase